MANERLKPARNRLIREIEWNDLFGDIEFNFEGNLHIYAEELHSRTRWTHRENDVISTASTIKLPILMHAAMLVESGRHSWDEILILRDDDKVGGMGVLRHMHHGLRLTMKDVCYLMTVVSDNTATNMMIDYLGLDAINDRIASFGLHQTRLNRKAFSPDNPASQRFGLGQTTAAEMATLLRIIYDYDHARDASVAKPGIQALEDIRDMLLLQQDLVGIHRVLPHGWIYAGKTGRINPLRADAGYVRAPDGREWILSMFCFGLETENWTIENDGLLAIAEATRIILGLKR